MVCACVYDLFISIRFVCMAGVSSIRMLYLCAGGLFGEQLSGLAKEWRVALNGDRSTSSQYRLTAVTARY